MVNTDQAAASAERTAAGAPAGPSAQRPAEMLAGHSIAALTPAELTARRRGTVRRFFYEHPLVMDLVIVVLYLLLSAGTVIGHLVNGASLHLILTLISAGALMFRRARPVSVVVLLTVIETVLLVQDPLSSNASLSLWFGLYAVAVQRGRIFSFITTAAASLPLVLVLLLFFRFPAPMVGAAAQSGSVAGVITAVVVLLSNVIATGIGLGVRRDREHEVELRSWADRNAQLASVSERNRIAREMHDVVAHSLTVMIALSDGAAVALTRRPARAAEVLAELSRTGRTALSDMRRVLGVLRADGSVEADGRAPLPAGAGMETLLDGFRTAGLPVSLTRTGPALPDDPAFQLTVYRILQESLTNALRYGRAISRVQVDVTHSAGQVRLRISDDGRGSTAETPSLGVGQGIAGMRERAGIYAGTVKAGPCPYGGWVVEAVLDT
ncbi:sensor histidine kinase [Arthrobacter sp. H14-L1]|uniref:sensor histidine kinase n=1 Tax=Arthrobacter sp. H14-L1 TaxID=2996697 RepID=UPI00226F833E|nr:histidine kinase [Arthrobacter sp. H14-L1]